MGIEFSRSYKASDGKCYATLGEAQEVEIAKILGTSIAESPGAASCIVAYAQEIINVLTITDSSRPRARGMKKPRKPKATVTPQPDAQAAA